MNNLNLDYISIGPRRYGLNLLNPIDGLEWGNYVLEFIGPLLGRALRAADLTQLQALELDQTSPGELNPALQTLLGSVLSALSGLRTKEVSELQKAALQRCFTPENEPLDNMAVFNSWFGRYPGDLHVLGWRALFRLVRDFFPGESLSGLSSLLKTAATCMSAQDEPKTQAETSDGMNDAGF